MLFQKIKCGLTGVSIIFIMVLSISARAEFEIGTGNSSITGGRYVPSLDLAYLQGGKIFAWSATGVKSSYYFQSSHLVAFFKSLKAGKMWGADVNSGVGGAAAYTVRGYKDEGAASEQKDSDFLIGPAFRMNLNYKMIYFNINAIFGIRNIGTHVLSLTFQDVQSLSVGIRF